MKFLLFLTLGALALVQLTSADKSETVPEKIEKKDALAILNEKATQDFIVSFNKKYVPATPIAIQNIRYRKSPHKHHAKLKVVFDIKCAEKGGVCKGLIIKFKFHGKHHFAYKLNGKPGKSQNGGVKPTIKPAIKPTTKRPKV